jgi:hypothetical protein
MGVEMMMKKMRKMILKVIVENFVAAVVVVADY